MKKYRIMNLVSRGVIALSLLLLTAPLLWAQSSQSAFIEQLQSVVADKATVTGGIFSPSSQLYNALTYTQQGSGNRISNTVTGQNNTVTINQSGDGNEVLFNLAGNDNRYMFTQQDGHNTIVFENTVTTNGAGLTVTQEGGGNTLKTSQNLTGSGIDVKIIQQGGATAIINSPFYSFPK